MKTYKYTINGADYEVVIEQDNEQSAVVTVNGEQVEITKIPEEKEDTTLAASAAAKLGSTNSGNTNYGVTNSDTSTLRATTPGATNAEGSSAYTATAPLPGVIVSIDVTVGQAISKGQCLCVLEAMKMENNIESEVAGTVSAIHIKEGDSVLEGAPLITIQ